MIYKSIISKRRLAVTDLDPSLMVQKSSFLPVEEHHMHHGVRIPVIIDSDQLVFIVRITIDISIHSAEETIRFSPNISDLLSGNIEQSFVRTFLAH